jgi:hypothetical protein
VVVTGDHLHLRRQTPLLGGELPHRLVLQRDAVGGVRQPRREVVLALADDAPHHHELAEIMEERSYVYVFRPGEPLPFRQPAGHPRGEGSVLPHLLEGGARGD